MQGDIAITNNDIQVAKNIEQLINLSQSTLLTLERLVLRMNTKQARFFAMSFNSFLTYSYVLAIICFVSVYRTNTKLDTCAIFSQTKPPRLVDCLTPIWECMDVKCFF